MKTKILKLLLLISVILLLIISYYKNNLYIKDIQIYYKSWYIMSNPTIVDLKGHLLPISSYMESIRENYNRKLNNEFNMGYTVITNKSLFKLTKLQSIISQEEKNYKKITQIGVESEPRLICIIHYKEALSDTIAFSRFDMSINSDYYEIDENLLFFFASLLPKKEFQDTKDYFEKDTPSIDVQENIDTDASDNKKN